MYPDKGAPEEEMYSASEGKGKMAYHLEALVPIILILIIGVFLAAKFDLIDVPYLSDSTPAKILVIGQPSQETMSVFEEATNRDVVKTVRIADAETIEHNTNVINQYDIIWLDQSMQADKTIPRRVGEAIADYVGTGGKLVIVQNSGIKREGDISVLGWKATFGDIVPVSCADYGLTEGQPSCLDPQVAVGVIYAADEEHKIMQGTYRFPILESQGYLSITLYPVAVDGKEIAYFKDERTDKYYPAIVEKSFLGKVIYFNYNPGIAEDVLIRTIQYLH
ncbi:MAG: hypothetical protein ABH821_04105 [archaeon]